MARAEDVIIYASAEVVSDTYDWHWRSVARGGRPRSLGRVVFNRPESFMQRRGAQSDPEPHGQIQYLCRKAQTDAFHIRVLTRSGSTLVASKVGYT